MSDLAEWLTAAQVAVKSPAPDDPMFGRTVRNRGHAIAGRITYAAIHPGGISDRADRYRIDAAAGASNAHDYATNSAHDLHCWSTIVIPYRNEFTDYSRRLIFRLKNASPSAGRFHHGRAPWSGQLPASQVPA
jgi:hypothetical protein